MYNSISLAERERDILCGCPTPGLPTEVDRNNISLSHVDLTGNRRGVRGGNVLHQETDGVRETADSTFERAGVVLG